ncbi:MAG: DUF1223 domain-containing protein [Betaproteobacteria bacterium]
MRTLPFALMAISTTSVQAAECHNFGNTHTQSGAAGMAIAELYTAEGCDSCPPADKWFSSLSARKGNAVPLAFHVDYWDGGGWKDRFAKPQFTRRQQESVVRLGSRTVVTPQLFVNGKTMSTSGDDKRGSLQSRFNKRTADIASITPKAALVLDTVAEEDTLTASLSTQLADGNSPAVEAWLAVTENNLASRVTAGENSGVTLYHDHVVRELVGPLKIAGPVVHKIVVDKAWKRQDLTLVAFAQDRLTGEVLQAVSTGACAK